MGLFGMDTVEKLNGPAEPLSLDPFCVDSSVSLELKDGLTGLRRFGAEPSGLCGWNVYGDKESLLKLEE